jgi:hypothetical protein
LNFIQEIKKMYNEYEQEIAAKNMERRLSITFQLGHFSENVQKDIQKSIADDISYTEDFKIEKTGKEIKEKLQIELSTIGTEKLNSVTKMESLVKEIGCLPNGKPEWWGARGYEKYLGSLPMQYSHEQIYPNETKCENEVYDSLTPTTSLVSKDIKEKMREYNRLASDYISRSVEEIKLRTVIQNLSDTKKIKLSPQLAAQLGF